MKPITFMSYNIKVGSWTERGLDAVADVIAAADPDIVALQEVDRLMARTGMVDQAAWLGERLGYYTAYGAAVTGQQFGAQGGEYGVAMLSRWPIVQHERCFLFHEPSPPEQRPSRYHTEQRVILGCAIHTDDALIDVFCTHFDLTPDQRIRQAHDVVHWITTWHPGRPAVLMGDFNSEPDAQEMATLRTALVDVFDALGVGGDERITFPAGPLGSRTPDGWRGAIDYIWTTEHWRDLAIEVIREEAPASDHAPVVARATLAPAS
jgi:endonuclease/exonuclease/phosphatase family metal-dependent hydrolase